jgi:DNA polymerase-1
VQIVSSDKDLMQLIVEDSIELYDPMKSKSLGAEAVLEKFGVTPDKVVDVQALMGDSVDNVPGAPGIGQKTAAELINTYGSLDALLERAGEIKQPKRRETLINFAEQIRVSRTLVTLKDDVAVEDTLESFAVRDFEDGVLLPFLDDMEFRTLGRRVREQLAKEPDKLTPHGVGEAAPVDAINYEAYVAVDSAEALQAWIARAQALGVLAVHTEVKVRSPVCEDLVGVALALGPNDACYIPLAHSMAPARDGPADLFSQEAPLDLSWRNEALALLKPLLADPTVLKVGHDIKTAIDACAPHGLAIAPYDCTLCISYALGGGLHEHDLASLAERHFGHTLIGFGDVAGKGKAQVTFDRVPVAAAVRYSAEDADLALRLWKKLKPELMRERLRTVYETLERPLPSVLAAMEREGVRIDPQVLNRLSGDFAQRMAGMEDEAQRLVGRPFNIGSPKQLGEILFDEMSLGGGSKTKPSCRTKTTHQARTKTNSRSYSGSHCRSTSCSSTSHECRPSCGASSG